MADSGLLNSITGGVSETATSDENQALAGLMGVGVPNASQLDLPELQQYAVSQNMTPAQMQAFLQQNNALNAPVAQQGTAAQIAAINQLAGVANAGAAGSPTEQAQIAQALQQSNANLQGQRGAIDQQAQARGVAPGMLQAALGQVQSGQDQQAANQAALQAQGQNYQAALAAMASGAGAGATLQGQQNTQANTVAQAQNAMQQFNAANQQAASGTNAGMQQQANSTNAAMANQVGQANTGLANQRTTYNAAVPQTVFNDQMQKATGVANQQNQGAGVATQQGQQGAGLFGGLLGTAGTVVGGMYGGPAGAALGGAAGGAAGNAIGGGNSSPNSGTANANPSTYGINQAYGGIIAPPYAKGGIVQPYAGGGMIGHSQCFHDGGICLTGGGFVPGKPKVPGDSLRNDVVPAKLSSGEAVLPRTVVQQNPATVHNLLAQRGNIPQQPENHHPADIAALLGAMRHLRGAGQP